LQHAAILVFTTLPDLPSAKKLADALGAGRLAASVTLGTAVESMYHWRGAIETATEIPLWAKTLASRYDDVEATIRRLHPYELPEVVAVPITHALPAYLAWIAASATRSA
jgi:periplasmic divalent cation tolerance protein